jgi:hypothetical protein
MATKPVTCQPLFAAQVLIKTPGTPESTAEDMAHSAA